MNLYLVLPSAPDIAPPAFADPDTYQRGLHALFLGAPGTSGSAPPSYDLWPEPFLFPAVNSGPEKGEPYLERSSSS